MSLVSSWSLSAGPSRRRTEWSTQSIEVSEPRLLMSATNTGEQLPQLVGGSFSIATGSSSDPTPATPIDHARVCGCVVCRGMVRPLPSGSSSGGSGGASQSGTANQTIPVLRSNPSATVRVFLDFDGHTQATWGSFSNIVTPQFSSSGTPGTGGLFTTADINVITETWSRVAEKFSPFNVDVTTELPADQSRGRFLRIVIGGSSNDWLGSPAGGVAYVNSFMHSSIPPVVYVFSEQLARTARYIAEAAAHEAGHAFGLRHQSLYTNGTLTNEYHPGSGDWAPIMGNSYDAIRGIWHNGTSTSSTTFQDDLAIIAGTLNGFGFRAETAGTNLNNAVALTTNSSDQGTASGVISRNGEEDFYRFDTWGGASTFTLNRAPFGGMLAGTFSIRTSSGTTVASATISLSGATTLSVNLAAGSYRIVVSGGSQYGSLGQYSIQASAPGLSSGTTGPTDITGAYAFGSTNAAIMQTGSNFIMIDGNGTVRFGRFQTSNTIIIDATGVTGTISSNQIAWSNGQTWTRSLSVSGGWRPAVGGVASISQSGNTITLTNRHGATSHGTINADGTITATNWGNLVGTISGTSIHWSNGSRWDRNPNLFGVYTTPNGQAAGVFGNSSSLSFINRAGSQSSGSFNSLFTFTASGWGGLRGMFAGNRIVWENGTVWTQNGSVAATSFTLPTNWVAGPGTALTTQIGSFVIFTNRFGNISTGFFTSNNTVVATGWGNLVGTISGNQLQWSNGSTWTGTSSGSTPSGGLARSLVASDLTSSNLTSSANTISPMQWWSALGKNGSPVSAATLNAVFRQHQLL
jgi:hypothetical protein